ncbi:HbrB-like-domain-containing protein [Trametes polyzona]|nr:HbrB-like-domain-containing protein [Trametes polyzona]
MAGRSAHVRLVAGASNSSASPATTKEDNKTAAAETANVGGRGRKTMRTPDVQRRRWSSQGDATPRPADGHTAHPEPTTTTTTATTSTRRLGFLGDILLPSAGNISLPSPAASVQRSSPIPHAFLPSRSHSRGDSALARDNAASPSPAMASSSGQPAKGHTSPSKPAACPASATRSLLCTFFFPLPSSVWHPCRCACPPNLCNAGVNSPTGDFSQYLSLRIMHTDREYRRRRSSRLISGTRQGGLGMPHIHLPSHPSAIPLPSCSYTSGFPCRRFEPSNGALCVWATPAISQVPSCSAASVCLSALLSLLTPSACTQASSTRTYDSKLVSREMHRLGNLAHLPSLALAPALSATPSNIALATHMAPPPGAGPTSLSAARDAAENPWTSLHVFILPLFNDEPLRVPVEDLNQLVKRHIQTVVAAAPGKAVATLEHDTRELVASGMVTLNAKLAGVEDESLIPRVVELWQAFWTQVLPYLEGALLPLQTDPILSSLYRLPKAHRPASPTAAQNGKGLGLGAGVGSGGGAGGGNSGYLASSGGTQIDVRALALVAFRDRVVLPLYPRLNARLTMPKEERAHAHASDESSEPYQARLQQMLLVLVSQRSQRLASLSLTAPPPQPTAGEAAIAHLLRGMHHHHGGLGGGPGGAHARARTVTGAPSFLSAGLPRDRRGRIGARGAGGSVGGGGVSGAELDARGRWRLREEDGEDSGAYGYSYGGAYGAFGYGLGGSGGGGGGLGGIEGEVDTPRVGVSFIDPGRERDKELLESLRSPDPDDSVRMSMGGWGLGAVGREEEEYDDDEEEEEEEENMDWDSAQHEQRVVERMVGIKTDSLPPTPSAHQQQQMQQQQQQPPLPAQQQISQDSRRRMI